MNVNDGLRIIYTPAQATEEAHEGWGSGQLWLEGQAFWFFGTQDQPESIDWTWIEMLEHLASCWPFLQIESPFPYPWIDEAMREGANFWQIADDRWEGIDTSQADKEESQILKFANAHNLAAGWQGLSVPALYWYRQGNEVLLCPEERKPIRLSYGQALSVLEQFGNTIANGLSGSVHPHAIQALHAWKVRNDTPIDQRITIATGLDLDAIVKMQGDASSNQFWDIREAANEAEFNANALLAAARMTSASLAPEEIAGLLERLRKLPPAIELPELAKACEKLEELDCRDEPPHEAGYRLANYLRNILDIEDASIFDPEAALSQWGVKFECLDMGLQTLEAIAVWGNKGPAVLVNVRPEMRTSHEYGYRFVLAHEIAHLLIDRRQTLAAAEVLGGGVSKKIEQRADAFAAELLLPRQTAAKVYREEPHLDAAVKRLVATYKIGRKVAKAQIKNSGAANPVDESEIELALGIEWTAR